MIHIPLPFKLYLSYKMNGKLSIRDIKKAIVEDFFIIH